MRQEPLVSNSPGAVRTIGPTNMKIATTKMIFNISEKNLPETMTIVIKTVATGM